MYSLQTPSDVLHSTFTILVTECRIGDSLRIEGPRERTEHLDISFFLPITQWCSISDVLFTGGRGMSDFSVLKYY